MTSLMAPPAPVGFEVIHPNAEPGKYGSADDPSPYIHLASPDQDIENMLDKDALVIAQDAIKVMVDYPLDREVTFELKSDAPEGFKRAELAQKVCDLYQHIFQVESETAPDPGRAAPNLMNRGASHGSYGIYGHDLGDLLLHCVLYDEAAGVWSLGVDS